MDKVNKLSRREAKPLMGRPNVLSNYERQPTPLIFGINLGFSPKIKKIKTLNRGGKTINNMPVITPSPQNKRPHKETHNSFPRQQRLFSEYAKQKRNRQRTNDSYLQPFLNLGHKRRLFQY